MVGNQLSFLIIFSLYLIFIIVFFTVLYFFFDGSKKMFLIFCLSVIENYRLNFLTI